MHEAASFTLGATVSCQDGECGELRRVVVDSKTDVVTHLEVGPRRGRGKTRLVPIELVQSVTAHEIRLTCTLARFGTLSLGEERDVTQGVDYAKTLPRLHLFARGGVGAALGSSIGPVFATSFFGPLRIKPHANTEENLAAGEGEVWRGQPIHASDGQIGHLYGLVLDADGKISHVLLGEGHLWGKKEVSIPVSAVKTVVDDGLYLTMTKHEVGELPSVDLEPIA